MCRRLWADQASIEFGVCRDFEYISFKCSPKLDFRKLSWACSQITAAKLVELVENFEYEVYKLLGNTL
jgi:hypothetical protein